MILLLAMTAISYNFIRNKKAKKELKIIFGKNSSSFVIIAR